MSVSAQRLAGRFEGEKICRRWEALIHAVLHSATPEALHADLAARFMQPPKDETGFLRRAVLEYEKHAALLVAENADRAEPFRWIGVLSCSLKRYGWRKTLQKIMRRFKKIIQRRHSHNET